ncbi:hypothetical protein [Mongoliibacter ruber]|uniref:Uncharacterized protein n=1 Tax=Mongoliibacter ruber TaxID=1750599 RepID=A0A2T0WV46_9BACT|nr:hypothetical protein [Mongoliibacter ruber]PRY90571.1 hypothetical protein CLW00_101234 [Mongoliibacter ruber]
MAQSKDLEDKLRSKINQASRDSQKSYGEKAAKIHEAVDNVKSIGKALDGLLKKGAAHSKSKYLSTKPNKK